MRAGTRGTSSSTRCVRSQLCCFFEPCCQPRQNIADFGMASCHVSLVRQDFVAAVLDGKALDAGPESAMADLGVTEAMVEASKQMAWVGVEGKL